MFDLLAAVARGLTTKFPRGNDPYQLMTRLLEECGELAQEVNHFEDSGIKRAKYGDPAKARLAEEASHALRSLMQIIQLYHVEAEVADALMATYARLKQDGFLGEEIHPVDVANTGIR